MQITHHAQERTERLAAFAAQTRYSLSARDILALLRKVTCLAPRLCDYLLVICKADETVVAPDGSNGDMLCALVRDRRIVTLLLRRSDQRSRFDGLPYVAVTGDDAITII